MTTLLDRGIQAHARRMKTGAGRCIVYQRQIGGILCAVNMIAWPGESKFERTNEEQLVTVIVADRCYLFPTADLFLNGANVLPEKGDRIVETIDGQLFTFEVMFDQNRPVWEFNDLTRQILRVWTKRVRPL